MTRFAWALAVLVMVLLIEVWFLLFVNHDKHASAIEPELTPLVFPEIHGPQPKVNFRPLFNPSKAINPAQQGFHLLGIVAEGNVRFALVQAPSGTKIVKIGDTVDGAQVVDIHKKDVLLQAGETHIHLHLLEKGNVDGQ